jgi:lauroyl/myristoyl acyltransferase
MKLELEPQKNLLFRSLSLYLTRPVLERGGVVRIASDGYHGTNAIYTPFHGRLRPFREGFAELAVTTGADVIPVFTSFDITGRFKVDFLAPLEVEHNKTNRQEKIGAFIRQYVYLLERRWAEEPGNIAWGMLEDYFASPPATVEGLAVEQT